jgi:hypothetical protein
VESKFYIRGKKGFNKKYGTNDSNSNNSSNKGYRSSLVHMTAVKEEKIRLVSAFVPKCNVINDKKVIHVKKRNVVSNDVVGVYNTQVQTVSLSCSPKKCKNSTIKKTSLKLNVNNGNSNKNKNSVSRNRQYKSITQKHSRQISFDIKKQSNELSFNKTKCSLNTSISPVKHKNSSTSKYKYNTHTKCILKTIIANYTDRNTPIKQHNNNINSTLNATCSSFNRRHRTSLLYNSNKPKYEIKTKLKEKVFKLVNQQQYI